MSELLSAASAHDVGLSIEGTDFAYGGIVVLRGVSMCVAPGEVVGVVGEREAGKSTLVMGIAGVVRASGGRILGPGGCELTGLSTHGIARHVALVPERDRLFPGLTVDENLLLAACSGTSMVRSNVDEFYQTYPQIGRAVARPASTLSGGEAALVAIERALLTGLRAVVVDEPFIGLSPAWVSDVGARLRVAAASGRAVILTDEAPERATAWCDRVLHLSEWVDR